MTTQIFGQSRNPVNTFNSRISPPFCFEIPNPNLQVREIPDPEKPIGDSAYITWGVDCSQSPIFSWDYWGIARVTVNFPNVPRGRASGIIARGGASSQTAPAPQVQFDTHARWQPVTLDLDDLTEKQRTVNCLLELKQKRIMGSGILTWVYWHCNATSHKGAVYKHSPHPSSSCLWHTRPLVYVTTGFNPQPNLRPRGQGDQT